MQAALKKIPIAGIVSGIFIILFTYTAVNKLIDYPTFRIAVVQSPVLKHYADWVIVGVPVVELIIVALLAVHLWKAGFGQPCCVVAFTLYISYLVFLPNCPATAEGL